MPGRTIGFVMPTLEDYFAMRLINAIQDTLRAHGYSLVIAFSGGSKTLSLNLKPGTYKFYCSVPGHRQAGMEGTLTVQ